MAGKASARKSAKASKRKPAKKMPRRPGLRPGSSWSGASRRSGLRRRGRPRPLGREEDPAAVRQVGGHGRHGRQGVRNGTPGRRRDGDPRSLAVGSDGPGRSGRSGCGQAQGGPKAARPAGHQGSSSSRSVLLASGGARASAPAAGWRQARRSRLARGKPHGGDGRSRFRAAEHARPQDHAPRVPRQARDPLLLSQGRHPRLHHGGVRSGTTSRVSRPRRASCWGSAWTTI